ncbi:MAG: peptide ABC transporter substrate-binding protein [Clostridia bacterium]|nr:peptide ABC transporter substrate-binding protein [Clostridia bacterium]
MKKYLALLLAALMILAAFAGCKGGETGTEPEQQGSSSSGNASSGSTATEPEDDGEPDVLRMLYDVENTTLNYLSSGKAIEHYVCCNFIDGLVEFDNHSNVIPALAESWEVSPDGTVWTFKIREGQYWYNAAGEQVAEVTAEDWVSALKLVCTPLNDSGTYDQVKIIKGAEEYYNGLVEKTNPDFADVGVKAVDKYTLEYTLKRPTPYFLQGLAYVCWMPAYGPLIDEHMSEEAVGFGTSIDKIYSCGSYILTEWEPQVKQTLVKNENNWDADRVYIDRIEKTYNAEAATLAPTMVLRDEIDFANISNDILDDWKNNNIEYLSKSRQDDMWHYFYAFDFKPTYPDEYKPEDWMRAVVNSNFRHAIMSALDRDFVVKSAVDPEAGDSLMQNTITPKGSCFTNAGADFASNAAFNGIEENFYNPDKALEYKAKAMEELKAKGVTFPIQVVISYQSGEKNYENECIIVKQQLEKVLGTDFIQLVLWAGPAENFLSETRSSGKYSLMRVRWGADYIDPQTWTDPFDGGVDADSGIALGNSYNRWELIMDETAMRDQFGLISDNSINNYVDEFLADPDLKATAAILAEYYDLVEKGRAEGVDIQKRFDYFAQAEALLINNAMVIPCYVGAAKYQATKLNVFEGSYAACGYAVGMYKGMHLQDEFISMDQYEANYQAWLNGEI